jgi:parallel beta-helix repeat protein
MRKQISTFIRRATLPVVLMAGTTILAQQVSLSPGMNIQAAVNDAPAGSTFLLSAGVYRMQSIVPKNGDIFIGQGSSTVFNGSIILTFTEVSSSPALWVAPATPTGPAYGQCGASTPMCGYPQDLFIDNVLQQPAASLDGLQTGSWYFDQTNNLIYLPFNPTGHTVELSDASMAFYGVATGVQISNLVVEKYANHAQQGAIGDAKEGTQWTVNQVEVRWTHGAGVELGPNSTLTNSFIHHNGQLGIALGGLNCQATGNEISWNNYAGFLTSWEAGGSKFWATTNLVVNSNYVHDNNGPGLWTDFNNVNTTYENNIVTNNLNEGIKHEISFAATIRNNTVRGNGNTATVWAWNAQIELQNSSNSEISGNTVEVPVGGGNGIAVINQNRGSGALGPWVGGNDTVLDNTIYYDGTNGVTGFVDDTQSVSTLNNTFDSNKYVLTGGGPQTPHWILFNGIQWGAFQAAGMELHGTCCN